MTAASFAEMTLNTIEMLGVEQVAIGTDSSCGWADSELVSLRHGRMKLNPPPAAWPQWPSWYRGPEQFARLRDELGRHGLTDAQLDGLLGDNWRRFLGRVLGEENICAA